MGLFFNKKDSKKEKSRDQLLAENANVPFTTEISDDISDAHLALIYKNVACPIMNDVSDLQTGAVLYMKKDGLLGNCCGEIVGKVEDPAILRKIDDFFQRDKYCTIRTKYISASDNCLIINIGFYKDGIAKKTSFISEINKDPSLANKLKAEVDDLYEVDIDVDSSNILHEQKLSDMPEIKIANITKSFVVDAKLPSFVVVDVETTGLNVRKDKIIQLSAIRFENKTPVECFNTYINPETHISEGASKINNIFDADVKNAPLLSEVANGFCEFIGKSPIVGYNISFDLSFLYCGGIDLITKRKIYDAMVLAKKIYAKELDNYALKDVLELYGMSPDMLHDSKVDCFMTGTVFLKMIRQITNQ